MLDSFLDAVQKGLRLPRLEELSITFSRQHGADAWDLGWWRNVLAAAPSLTVLRMKQKDFHPFAMSRSSARPLPNAGVSPPVGATSPFKSQVTSLTITGVPAAPSAAIATFVNAFSSLLALQIDLGNALNQADLIQALRLPQLQSLEYNSTALNDPRLALLDLQHLPRPNQVQLGGFNCSPEFHLNLPPSVRKVGRQRQSQVPLAALIELIQPGSWRLPDLAELHISVPPFGDWKHDADGRTVEEMAEWPLEQMGNPSWSEEASREGLRATFQAAEAQGVAATGNCTSVFAYERAILKRVHDTDAAEFDDYMVDEIYRLWDGESGWDW